MVTDPVAIRKESIARSVAPNANCLTDPKQHPRSILHLFCLYPLDDRFFRMFIFPRTVEGYDGMVGKRGRLFKRRDEIRDEIRLRRRHHVRLRARIGHRAVEV